jgi:hypothetical protein
MARPKRLQLREIAAKALLRTGKTTFGYQHIADIFHN